MADGIDDACQSPDQRERLIVEARVSDDIANREVLGEGVARPVNGLVFSHTDRLAQTPDCEVLGSFFCEQDGSFAPSRMARSRHVVEIWMGEPARLEGRVMEGNPEEPIVIEAAHGDVGAISSHGLTPRSTERTSCGGATGESCLDRQAGWSGCELTAGNRASCGHFRRAQRRSGRDCYVTTLPLPMTTTPLSDTVKPRARSVSRSTPI